MEIVYRDYEKWKIELAVQYIVALISGNCKESYGARENTGGRC